VRGVADRVILAWGWRRAAVACVGGAFGALAMPPFGLWPALAVSLSVAVWLIDGSAAGRRYSAWASLRVAAIDGWFWGLGYFVAGLWWIGAAFLVEADVFAWLLPFGVLGLPALLAFFPALGFALARALWSRGAGRLFAFAFGMAAAEWLRGHVLTGFPWNTLGMAFGQNLVLLQTGSILGLYGLTILACLVLAAPAVLATGETRAARLAAPAGALLALAAMTVFGFMRLPPRPTDVVPGVKLRIMQPNLAQDAKFNPSAGGAILDRYIALSDRATSPDATGLSDVTHLIWPESAFPFLLHREPAALARIGAMLPRGGVLITGAAREGARLPGESGRRFFNSVQVVADDGSIVAGYDKVHLVPFGEYVPRILDGALRALGIRQFVHIPGGFTAGERRLALNVPGLPAIAATVCYEAIFPDEVWPAGSRPGLILNVTNDGWFGDTPGPRQHFAQARLRAVEQGLPLVRAANTGISAVIDPYGRVLATLPVGVEGVLDSALPRALNGTLYEFNGRFLNLLLLLACAATALAARRFTPGRTREASA
jgi:apolipoprotein N-acyltransferase